jgi:hypothetical protein
MKSIGALILLATLAFGQDTFRIFDHTWSVPIASDWSLSQEDGVPVLQLSRERGPLPGPRRPIQFALTDTPAYNRLIFEADVKPLGRSLMLVFAYRDPAHFDYAHLSVDTGDKQPVHNGIFHVYGGERVRISRPDGPPSFAATGQWYHVTLRHDANTGQIDVTVDGHAVPALHAVDVSLSSGKVGLGSFDERAVFKNVKILSETSGSRSRL